MTTRTDLTDMHTVTMPSQGGTSATSNRTLLSYLGSFVYSDSGDSSTTTELRYKTKAMKITKNFREHFGRMKQTIQEDLTDKTKKALLRVTKSTLAQMQQEITALKTKNTAIKAANQKAWWSYKTLDKEIEELAQIRTQVHSILIEVSGETIFEKADHLFSLLTPKMLEEEGVFRISPNLINHKEFLIDLLAGTLDIKQSKSKITTEPAHIVAHLIKDLLKKHIEGGVVPEAIRKELLEAVDPNSKAIDKEKVRIALTKLDGPNQRLLKQVIELAGRIDSKKDSNKMAFSKLAIVFTCLLDDTREPISKDPMVALLESQLENKVIAFILANPDIL